MSDTPIYSQLVKHHKLDYSPFHTPGHKCAGFFPPELLSLDLTELPDTDALYEASGIILEAEKNLAELFGAKRTLISGSGCTLAIQTMLRLASQRGGKILFARNIHRSAVNAAALLGIEPVWVMPYSDSGLFTGRVKPEDIEQALKKDSDITACYVTSPDYYGELTDIKALSEICHSYGAHLLVDNAHGSHLAFTNKNLHPIHLGADMSACSLHKTLPVLTGGAVLNIANEEYVDRAKQAMSLFGSTSPSYPIMASIDLCCDYLRNGGTGKYREAEERVGRIKLHAKKNGLIQPDGECDPLRVCINTSCAGIKGNEQTEFFHRHKIEPEFCDGSNAVFICTPFNSEKDFTRLETAIDDFGNRVDVRLGLSQDKNTIKLPESVMTPREAVFSKNENVPVNSCCGRIASDSACPCPPGIPVIMPGERIDEDVISRLLNSGIETIRCAEN